METPAEIGFALDVIRPAFPRAAVAVIRTGLPNEYPPIPGRQSVHRPTLNPSTSTSKVPSWSFRRMRVSSGCGAPFSKTRRAHVAAQDDRFSDGSRVIMRFARQVGISTKRAVTYIPSPCWRTPYYRAWRQCSASKGYNLPSRQRTQPARIFGDDAVAHGHLFVNSTRTLKICGSLPHTRKSSSYKERFTDEDDFDVDIDRLRLLALPPKGDKTFSSG